MTKVVAKVNAVLVNEFPINKLIHSSIIKIIEVVFIVFKC
ncbi:ORF150 [Staphylococcus phage 2638A]|uniref:ORF150 n=1 Tax=Staphylococcus phage 2638A TaxID=320836 RepID=Q4ZD57_BP263|nr:ORF150 [Staphylococcus phage 2638A]AAX91044.1 ORF150 [Staphylococcus phage 2638A]